MTDQPRELMTVAEVIKETGISRSTWQKLAAAGETPPIIKIGTVQRIRREAFREWLQSLENA